MIKQAAAGDGPAIAELALQLWGSHSLRELASEMEGLIQSSEAAVFLAYEREQPVGFAQCQLRHDYVEGSRSSPVGYLEGIYVEEAFRHQGIGLQLLRKCEGWAREKGCSEFASDCELDNSASLHFHLHCGFQEANRVICFIKRL